MKLKLLSQKTNVCLQVRSKLLSQKINVCLKGHFPSLDGGSSSTDGQTQPEADQDLVCSTGQTVLCPAEIVSGEGPVLLLYQGLHDFAISSGGQHPGLSGHWVTADTPTGKLGWIHPHFLLANGSDMDKTYHCRT